jgi:hypothetical protein
MNQLTKITRKVGVPAGVALGLLGIMMAARADVKVVSKVEVTRESSPVSRTITAYFKEERARLETGTAGKVALYDYKAGKLYILDSSAKTYYEKAIPRPGAKPDLPGRISQFVRIDITGNVKPISGGMTQSVAGISTKPYSLTSDVKVQPKQAGLGGRRGGGAQGMGLHVEGDFQGADVAAVIPGASADRLLLFTQQIMNSEMTPGPLAEDFLKLKVIPLKGKVTVTRSGSGGGGKTGATRLRPITVTMEVMKLEKNTTLDSSLFSVPKNYQKVDAPQRGMGDIAELGGLGGE